MMAMAMAMAMRAICPTFSSTNRPFIYYHHNAIANAAAAVAIVLEHSFQTYICSSASCSSTRRLHQLKQNNVHYPKEGIRLKVQCGNGGAKGRLILGITVVNVSKRYSGSPRNCGLGVHATTDEEYENAISIDLNEDTSKETSSSIGTSNEKLENGLYLVATPIGNLEDITLRALRVLKLADLILAEDTRHSAKILQHYNIRKPMMSYHKFNATARQDALVRRLESGQTFALITDAGTPGISDPGSELVMACIKANIQVHPIPGPSAIITAIVASGLPTNAFTFVGFLPTQERLRQKRLMAAANESATQIFFVPPHKLCSILESCIPVFGPDRICVVAREMTKIHEEFWRGTLDQALKEFQERYPRGEVTLLVAGLPESSMERFPTLEELESRLKNLIDAGESPSEAARRVAEESAVRRKLIYTLALKLSSKKSPEKT